MRRHWRFLFALNFIYTSLTFLWSIFVKPSLRFPFSVWKQKFKGNRIGLPSSRCSCPIACKREELIHSQVKLLSGFAEIGSFFFFFFFLFRPFPFLPSPNWFAFCTFLTSFCYWCACVLSLHQRYWKFMKLQMLVYMYIFTCLYCFGVDSRVVFSVRVKFSWLHTCCCSTWWGSSRLNYERGGWWVTKGPADMFALSTKASGDRKPLIADK